MHRHLALGVVRGSVAARQSRRLFQELVTAAPQGFLPAEAPFDFLLRLLQESLVSFELESVRGKNSEELARRELLEV